MTFSEKIKRAREVAQLTQAELAEKTGVTRRTIASYESGGAVARRITMMRLAKVLGVSFKYLSNEAVTDPLEDIDQDDYISEAHDRFGKSGSDDMVRLLAENKALFAGGELSPEQKDLFFQAVLEAYNTCRMEAKAKFGPKKQEWRVR